MTINYNGNIQVLVDAATKANELLANNQFYDYIAQKQGFDLTMATGQQVADSIKNCNANLTVFEFVKYFTRVLGYEDPNDPNSVHINVAGNKLNRSLGSIVGTYIHESVHAADATDNNLSYPHNGNSSVGNENTAPYWIGNLAIQMVDEPGSAVNINDIAVVPHAPNDEMNEA